MGLRVSVIKMIVAKHYDGDETKGLVCEKLMEANKECISDLTKLIIEYGLLNTLIEKPDYIIQLKRIPNDGDFIVMACEYSRIIDFTNEVGKEQCNLATH